MLVALAGLIVVGLASAMAVPKLKGAITAAGTISLRTSKGKTVKTLVKGTYSFVVNDTASIHNYTLKGPGISNRTITGTAFTGTKTVVVKLSKPGTYKVYCTIHPYIVKTFKVS